MIKSKLRPEQLSRAKRRVKQHEAVKTKEEIRKAKESTKELAQYVTVLKKEQIKVQKLLLKAQSHLARLMAKLDAA
jgi:hypothetical protein